MKSPLEQVIHGLSQMMWPVMAIWCGFGLWFLVYDVYRVKQDEKALDELKETTRLAQGSNYETKMEIRKALVNWADTHQKAALTRWIYTVHNAVYAGGQGDTKALADAIWSQERERHFWFRFFARNAIQVGLFFTSVGLCDTLSQVAPALTAKAGHADTWIKSVQTAMASALGGMSAAFYSSLAGLFVSLLLALLANILLTGRHESYLNKLDAFLQGSLIPIFTSIVEKDRNDLIREMLSRTEDAFEGIRKQFQTLVNQNQAQYQDLSQFRQSLAGTVKELDKQLGTFGKGVQTLTTSSDSLVAATQGIGQALEGGLKLLAEAHAQTMDLQRELQHDVVIPFTEQLLENSERNADNHRRVLGGLVEIRQEFRDLTTRIVQKLDQEEAGWALRHEQLQTSSDAMSQVITQHVNQSQIFYSTWERIVSGQKDALTKSADDQRQALLEITEFVKSFSITGEAIQRQLADIYDIHRQEVEKLYQSIGSELGKTLNTVVGESVSSLKDSLSEGLKKTIGDTHDRVMGLGDAILATVKTQEEAIAIMRQMQEAVAFNKDDLETELVERRTTLERLLAESVKAMSSQLSERGEHVFERLTDRIGNELGDSLQRQEEIIRQLNQTVGRKWEHLLTAYEAATGRTAVTP